MDYFTADGASAFDDLKKLLTEVSDLVGNNQTVQRWQESLKNGKLYLKGDFKVSLILLTQQDKKI